MCDCLAHFELAHFELAHFELAHLVHVRRLDYE